MKLNNQENFDKLDNIWNQEEEKTSKLIPFSEGHHEQLEECLLLLKDKNSSIEDKQASLSFFLQVFDSHAIDGEKLFAPAYIEAHDLAYDLALELKDENIHEDEWPDDLHNKVLVLTRLIKTSPEV